MSESGAPAFRRLHPASLVLGVVLRLRQVAVPVLVPALVVGNGGVRGPHAHRWLVVITVAAALVIALALAEYLALRFAMAPDALVIRSGVLRRVTRSIPYARIQGVSTAQTLPQRLLGVGTLRVDTGAGGQWTVTLLAALGVLSVLLGGGVWRLLWLLPLLWALTPLAWRVRGVGADGAYLVVREGALSRTTWVLPVAKLQQVQLRQGPFQRWLGLATVRLTTAGLGGVADVVDLPVADARMLVEDLVARLPALRRRRSASPAHPPVPAGAHVS